MRLRGRREGSGRFLATVLFVDIVGSTELASSIGDAAWETLLGRYYAAVRDRLKRHGGRQIDTAVDGLFAAFDAPADGIACALAIRDVAAGLGFATRAGLHMGEVQTIEGKVGGIAVHIGARIAAQAGPGEVLVSGTVRDLVEGSRLRLEDRGEAELKGLPGRWRLFLVLPPVVEAAEASPGGPSSGPIREGAADALGRLIPHSPWAPGVIVAIIALVVLAIVGDVLLAKGTATPSPSAVAQAIDTIKQADMYQKPVTIWTSPDPPFENVQQYFVGLLTSLGFKVTPRTMPDAQLFGGDPASPLTDAAAAQTAQMAGFYYYNQVPTAAQSFPGTFTCAGFADGAFDGLRYPQQLCDPKIDTLVQQALDDEQSSDPVTRALANDLWARIDRAVVDDAPAVFVFNPSDVNFFSQRVGNFQHQPQLDVLLDQLWVQ